MNKKEYLNGKLTIQYNSVVNMSKGTTTLFYDIDYSYGLITYSATSKHPCELTDSDRSTMEKALSEALEWVNKNIPECKVKNV